eukprot:13289117-Ditylum_brightwellii.AAC.1
MQHYIEEEWYNVPTNTQIVKRWVKDANECTYLGKDENFSSLIAACRSANVFDYKNISKEE